MHVLFLLNPTAGKQDCTRQLPAQINAAAARAGLRAQDYDIRITSHAGHARELARAAAAKAQQQGEELRIFTAGGD
ncbi:MAG: protein BmrU, partial [Faecalibacterium prausnitzii]|nr:protein BmrU [Faecalibacterium prausnitzii]